MFTATSPSRGAGSPRVLCFHDAPTGSCQYLVICPATRRGALIDVVQDFAPANAATGHDTAQAILRAAEDEGATIDWILDTHPHADHLMASAWLQGRLPGAQTGIGTKTVEIANLWRRLYNLPDAFHPAREFDRLFADGDRFAIGDLPVQVMLSPGHTLGSVTYVIGDAAFVHDTFMAPDSGTARADFPGGSARALYRSLQQILALADETRLFIGHDYCPDGRDDPDFEATVAEQRDGNVHLAEATSEDDFVALRDKRDATLALPDRMLQALQVNLRGGRLPPPEHDGHSYFKIPANRFGEPR